MQASQAVHHERSAINSKRAAETMESWAYRHFHMVLILCVCSFPHVMLAKFTQRTCLSKSERTGNSPSFRLLVTTLQEALPGIGSVPLHRHQLIATWAGVLPSCFCPISLISCIKGWTSLALFLVNSKPRGPLGLLLPSYLPAHSTTWPLQMQSEITAPRNHARSLLPQLMLPA